MSRTAKRRRLTSIDSPFKMLSVEPGLWTTCLLRRQWQVFQAETFPSLSIKAKLVQNWVIRSPVNLQLARKYFWLLPDLDFQYNPEHVVAKPSTLLQSIISLEEQLRVYGSDFTDLRSRLSQVETRFCDSVKQLEDDYSEQIYKIKKKNLNNSMNDKEEVIIKVYASSS